MKKKKNIKFTPKSMRLDLKTFSRLHLEPAMKLFGIKERRGQRLSFDEVVKKALALAKEKVEKKAAKK